MEEPESLIGGEEGIVDMEGEEKAAHERSLPRSSLSPRNLPKSSPMNSPASALAKAESGLHASPQDVRENSSDEEYFEEFNLPNTGENAFVRHVSFRRKVQKTPIHAPDAERIEGLVRTGEFVRHGSIRKKIVPEEDEFALDEEDQQEEVKNNVKVVITSEEPSKGSNTTFSERIQKDIQEIERYLSQENIDSSEGELRSLDFVSSSTPYLVDKKGTDPNWGKSPILCGDDQISKGAGSPQLLSEIVCDDLSLAIDDNPMFSPEQSLDYVNLNQSGEPSSLSIEQSTLFKIKSCLDFSNMSDIYNLCGRLQDILSSQEIEEFLSNSQAFTEFIDKDVVEALSASLSLAESSKSAGDASGEERGPKGVKGIPSNDPISETEGDTEYMSMSNYDEMESVRRNPDSGFSSPRGSKVEEKKRIPCTVTASVDDLSDITLLDDISSGASIRSLAGSTDTIGNEKLDPTDANILKCAGMDGDNLPKGIQERSMVNSRKASTNSVQQELVDDKVHGGEKISIIPGVSTETLSPSEGSSLKCLSEISTFSDGSENEPPFASLPPPPPDLIPELSAAEENAEERHWRNVVIGGAWRRIDMKVISPYRKCISHGGYYKGGPSAVIALYSALLPDKSRRDYHYVTNNLFMYVLSFLEQLASDDYVLVYFAWGSRTNSNPGFNWLRKAYQMIDRRLRKNLKELHVVHPSLWAKTVIALSRPFISAKFYKKLRFIPNLTELSKVIPLTQLDIPEAVKQADFELMVRQKKAAITAS